MVTSRNANQNKSVQVSPRRDFYSQFAFCTFKCLLLLRGYRVFIEMREVVLPPPSQNYRKKLFFMLISNVLRKNNAHVYLYSHSLFPYHTAAPKTLKLKRYRFFLRKKAETFSGKSGIFSVLRSVKMRK